MSRDEFVREYAGRSGFSDKWAVLGFIDVGGGCVLIALPCDCKDDCCQGWAMVSPDGVSSHLELYSPEPLRSAYCAAVRGARGSQKT